MSNKSNDNIQLAKSVVETINTGHTANVSVFISPTYYNPDGSG